MTHALSRRRRSMLLFLSAASYIAWFSGLGERGDAQGAATQVASLDDAPANHVARLDVRILRDPFAGAPESRPGTAAPSDERRGDDPSLRSASPPTRASDDMSTAATVPNIDGSDPPPSGEPRFIVRATIVGPRPVAYVAIGSDMEIVRVGDTLADRRIAKIDLRGIALDDGTRLDLPGAFAGAPQAAVRAVPAHPVNVTLKLDDLRALFGLATRGAQAPFASAAPTAAPVSTGTFPTPGPLPTVDRRGLSPGVNPTPNLSGPTPYPDPYPYAPPARAPQ